MHKYNVVKDCMNPWGTPITAGSTVEYSDTDFADEKVKAAVDALIADGSLTAFVEPPAPVIVEYVVVKGPVSNPAREVFQTGNVISFEEGDKFAEQMITAGLIMTKEAHAALVQEQEQQKKDQVPAPTSPTVPAVAGGTEPRLRYRGKIVVDEYSRTVGRQTFRHIRTEEGHEYDLTAAEFTAEVKLSYPPQN